jgi:hypothetical protein
MLEVQKPGFVFVPLGDESLFSVSGAVPTITIVLLVLFLVVSLMTAAVQKSSWQGAAAASLLWLCAGLFTRPWMFFANQSASVPSDDGIELLWKVLAIAWGVSLLFCAAVIISIYRNNQERRRRGYARRSRRRHRFQADGADVYVEQKRDSYEV